MNMILQFVKDSPEEYGLSGTVGRSVDDRSFLVARAERLQPLLADNAQQGAADRRVAEASIAALAEAGLFKVMLPRRYGGYEAGVRTSLEVMAAVAYGDGAAGWVVSLVNHSAWDIGLCPTRVQDDVFGADPDVLVCGSLAPVGTAVAVEGGVRLSGRWGYVSGSLHAQWAVLGFNLVDETGAVIEPAIAPVPAGGLHGVRHVVHGRDAGVGKQHADRRGRVRAPPPRRVAGAPGRG